MASLQAIRTALAANVAATGVQTSSLVLASPTPPVIEIEPGPVEYDLAAGRGLDRWHLTIRALVGLEPDAVTQQLLDTLIQTGAGGVKQAAESDRTLGGIVGGLRVTGCTGYRVFMRDGQPPAWGAEWTVDVYATGT